MTHRRSTTQLDLEGPGVSRTGGNEIANAHHAAGGSATEEHSPRTLATMSEVPRLGFLRAINPDVTAEDAYNADLAVTTLQDPDSGYE